VPVGVRHRGQRGRTGTGAAALAIAASALAAVLASPPYAVPGLGALALAPLVAALDGERPRRAFLLTWLWALAMALVVTRWLLHALVSGYGASPVWSALFAVLLIGALALVPATAAAVWARLSPGLADGAAPLAFAALWTLGEWLRAVPLGFPWLLAAHPFASWPTALQLAELGGAHALGFVVTGVAAGVGLALRRASAWPLAAPALLAAATLGFGAWRLAQPDVLAGETARVGVVQASVPQDERFQPGSAVRNVARHVEASRKLAAGAGLDLLVWSETAVDVDLDRAPLVRVTIERLAGELGVPIVTGAPRTAGGRHTNSVVLFTPDGGLAESYDKQRLVPYSEYDPSAGGFLAPLLGPVTAGRPYVPGARATVFRAGPLPFAAPVCFEITYPDLVRRFRANGAALLVNLSNDAWFGPVGYPEMHLAHAVFRAIESRSWVVRGANTGISAAIDPFGRVREALPAFTEGGFVVDVAPAGAPPFYARHGDAPVLLALVLALGLAVARRAPRGRARGRLALPARSR
jgi:apolipoprotein N-acyltransferase